MTSSIKYISEGMAKDMILSYCLEHHEKPIALSILQKTLFPSLTTDEVKLLLKKIDDTNDQVADVRFGEHNTLILSTGITKRFLDNGGFTAVEKNNELEIQRRQKKEDLEIELAISNLEANKLNAQIAVAHAKNEKHNRFATWTNIGIGIINIGLLIWQLLK